MIEQNANAKAGILLAIKMSGVLALLVWISQRWGFYYVDALLPLYRTAIDLILDNYKVLSLNLSEQNSELVIAAHLVTTKVQSIDGQLLPADVTLDASTLADHALKHIIIVITAILIWPGLKPSERGIRLLLSIPFLLLLEIVDIPFAIAGAVQDVVFFNLSSNYATNKPLLVTWLHLLDGGGRLALSLFVALVINLMPRIDTKQR